MKKVLNILLGLMMAITVALIIYAVASPHPANFTEFDTSISMNLMWGYGLFIFALACAVFCALFGMIKNPAGIKGTILSLILVIAVVGVSYFIASGHSIQIPDVQNNTTFGVAETVVTETSILVTYVAGAAAFVVAIATEIWGIFK